MEGLGHRRGGLIYMCVHRCSAAGGAWTSGRGPESGGRGRAHLIGTSVTVCRWQVSEQAHGSHCAEWGPVIVEKQTPQGSCNCRRRS